MTVSSQGRKAERHAENAYIRTMSALHKVLLLDNNGYTIGIVLNHFMPIIEELCIALIFVMTYKCCLTKYVG